MDNKEKYKNLIKSGDFELAYRLARSQGDMEHILEYLTFYDYMLGVGYKTFEISKNISLVVLTDVHHINMNFIKSERMGEGEVIGRMKIKPQHEVTDYVDDFTRIVDNILQIKT